MDIGRTSGWLVIGGWTLFAAGVALSNVAGSVVGGTVTSVSLAVAGAGAAGLAISNAPSLRGRVARVSLAILAAGLIAIACSSVVAAGLTYDPLENGPFVVLALGGALATTAGMLVTEISLLRTAGVSRTSGSLFFAGLAVLAIMSSIGGANADPEPLQIGARALALVGAIGFLIGCAGPGLLVVTGDHAAPAGSA
jgi:hypothetical protein